MDLIELLAPTDPEECVRNVSEFPDLTALTVDQPKFVLVTIYYISNIGKLLKKSTTSEEVVSVDGSRSPESVLQFKSVSNFSAKKIS